MYSTQEVAEKLGISRRRVQELLVAGRIKGKKIGRDWVVLDFSYERKRQGRPRRQKKGSKSV